MPQPTRSYTSRLKTPNARRTKNGDTVRVTKNQGPGPLPKERTRARRPRLSGWTSKALIVLYVSGSMWCEATAHSTEDPHPGSMSGGYDCDRDYDDAQTFSRGNEGLCSMYRWGYQASPASSYSGRILGEGTSASHAALAAPPSAQVIVLSVREGSAVPVPHHHRRPPVPSPRSR